MNIGIYLTILLFALLEDTLANSSPHSHKLKISPPEISVYQIGKEKRRFLSFPDQHLTISESCGRTLKEMTCQAAKSIYLASFRKLAQNKAGSRNPGSRVCSEVLVAKVVIGITPGRNENSFCLFTDGSMIDNGTLTFYAHENDARK